MRPLLAVAAWFWTSAAEGACRLALVLALDVSAGVDAVAYRQQLRSVAGALLSPPVARAVLGEPERPISLLVLEFASPGFQRVVLPWSRLGDEAALGLAAARLRAVRRAPVTGGPALGAALFASLEALEAGPACDRKVIDLSATSRNAVGPPPVRALSDPRSLDVTVNGLAVLPDRTGRDPEALLPYFRDAILHGPGAFLEMANGPSDYVRAITRKLLREISEATEDQ